MGAATGLSLWGNYRRRLVSLGRLYPRIMMTIIAIFVGVLGGGGAIIFHKLVELFQNAVRDTASALPSGLQSWWLVLTPAIGGLVVGLIVKFAMGGKKGAGVAGVMEAVGLGGGRIDPLRSIIRVIASSVTLGSGGSAGPEDPSVQVGVAAGVGIAKLLGLPGRRVVTLIACGAAAGITSAFNAPIAGAFFALEIILGEFSTASFGMVVISSVTSAALTQWVVGSHPTFQVSPYSFKSYWEFLFYLGLGVLAAIMSIFYIKTLTFSEEYMEKWRMPGWLKPAVGGLIVGLIGFKLPEIYSVGYETIENVLLWKHGWPILLLLAILLAKTVATGITLGSGGIGGVFAPSLFLGAILGAAYGEALRMAFPSLVAPPPAYAMVGMAAMLAGSVRSPITATLLLFEMTRDYRIILPLMFATVISLLISEAVSPYSIYTLELRKRGVWLGRRNRIDVMQGVTVKEIMSPAKDVVPPDMPATELEYYLNRTKHHGVPVVDDNGYLVGVVTLTDMMKAVRRYGSLSKLRVIDIATKNPVVVYPDDSAWKALKLMGVHDIGRIPVVSENDPRHLVGIVRRQDIVKAYRKAIQKEQESEEQEEIVNVANLARMLPLRLTVDENSAVSGKQVKELRLPDGCLLTALIRGNERLLIHGNVTLLPGDVVIALSTQDCAEYLRNLFAGEEVIEESRLAGPFE